MCFLFSSSYIKAEAPFGENLLINPSCDNEDFEGWIVNNKDLWNVDNGSWASSHDISIMYQTIDLKTKGFTDDDLNSENLYITASGRAKGPWSGESYIGIIRIYVKLEDNDRNELSTIPLCDLTYKEKNIEWATYLKQIKFVENTKYITFTAEGKDCKYWEGHYGPLFDDFNITINTKEEEFKYTINEYTDEYGIVYSPNVTTGDETVFTAGVSTIKAGEKVYLDFKHPDNRPEPVSYTISAANGDYITINEDNSFIMPYSNVEFTNVIGSIGGKITLGEMKNGSFSVDKLNAFEGESVQVTITPNEDYDVEQIIIKGDNEEIEISEDLSFIAGKYKNTTVDVKFIKKSNIDIICSKSDNGTVSTDKTIANSGELITLTILPDENYELKNLSVTSNEKNITVTDNTFIMPKGEDVKISAEFERVYNYQIICTEVENGTVSIDTEISSDDIKITISAIPDEVYFLESYEIDINESNNLKIDNKSTISVNISKSDKIVITPKFKKSHSVTEETPFFEGFENGYTSNSKIAVVSNWYAESILGNNCWIANNKNVDYNRGARTGDFNAILADGTIYWIYYPLYLTKDKIYEFEMYARQNLEDKTTANITVCIGSDANSEQMTETIVTETGVTDGDYQRLANSYTANRTGVHFLGIKSYVAVHSDSHIMSIDDISMKLPNTEDPLEINEANETKNSINVKGNIITIKAQNNNPKIILYDITGKIIINEVSQDNTWTSKPLSSGIYIISIDNMVQKLVIE